MGPMLVLRSLHEVAVTALYLLQTQGDTSKRYLDHAVVERFRSAEQYQMHCRTLGYEPLTNEEMTAAEKDMADAVQKYGAPFKKDYGWAADALGTTNPTFSRIEEGLDMSHWRPFYKMACQSVHAGAQGLHFSLAIPSGADSILLAGASNAGLSRPLLTTISLMMASVALFTFRPNLDGLIACGCMHKLCDDIGDAFWMLTRT